MKALFGLVGVLILAASVFTQANLLQASKAENSTGKQWKAWGAATIEDADGKKRFTVRNGGYFIQDVNIDPADVGKFLLLVGMGSSERVFEDNDITDHPYLYGYLMDGHHIFAYLQGDKMLWESSKPNEWRCMWGAFKIVPETKTIRFFLNQGSRKGTDHDGSAARFDDLGLFVVETREEAVQLANDHCSEFR